jgi:YbgC/YbaW family acyl-CoA thioester hydrolase
MDTNPFCWNRKVLFGDIDYYGVVYYLRYFDWCTQAREHFILSHFPDALEKTYSSVAEVVHKFHGPARLNDNIRIEVTFQDIRRASALMFFHIYRVTQNGKELIGEHRQKILFVDREGRVTRMLPEINSLMKQYEVLPRSADC